MSNRFTAYFIGAEPCVQLYGPCSSREELEVLWDLLEICLNHRLAYGFTARVREAIKDIEGLFAYAETLEDEECVEWDWTRDAAFDLFEEIVAARGCVFMLHPDFPGEAFLMSRAYARKAGFVGDN